MPVIFFFSAWRTDLMLHVKRFLQTGLDQHSFLALGLRIGWWMFLNVVSTWRLNMFVGDVIHCYLVCLPGPACLSLVHCSL
jgi:hypothetical protein